MMDRENVIRHIKDEIEKAKFEKIHYAHVSIDVLSDACELLQEQDETELCDRCGRRRLKSNRVEGR